MQLFRKHPNQEPASTGYNAIEGFHLIRGNDKNGNRPEELLQKGLQFHPVFRPMHLLE